MKIFEMRKLLEIVINNVTIYHFAMMIQDNNLIYSYGPYSYPDCGSFINKNQHLKIEDYEVLQIIKK